VAEPEWLDLDVVLEIHEKNLIRFGGATGLRDLGLLHSALARPQWLYEFDTQADLHRFAAAYAFGIVKNHPFVDGNKRVGFLSAYTFLRFNGWYVTATERDAVRAVLALAASDMSEADFAAWLRGNSERLGPT
jgi:death on curing protein